MDLRRAIFLKKPLHDISVSSLNSSSASLYESAAEDSDNSIYYSFSASPSKFLGDESIDVDDDHSITSEADKENTTVIHKEIAHDEKISPATSAIAKVMGPVQAAEIIEIDDNPEVIDLLNDSAPNDSDKSVIMVDTEPEPTAVQVPVATSKTPRIEVPEIIIEDPNQNVVNPFTLPSSSSSETDSDQQNMTPEQKSKLKDFKKKSATKIPLRSHFYSPVQRKSIDRKTKINLKPAQAPSVPVNAAAQSRRTVYDTRSRAIVKPRVAATKTSAPATSALPVPPKASKVAVPKVATAAVAASIKPALYKCTFAGCNREFRMQRTLQDHQKTHSATSSGASTSSSSSSLTAFKCAWCDKTFNLESALTGHKLEKCPKIPFNEKRKLIALEEKKEKNTDKRKSMFVAPAPKKRSPSRQTLNKSGVSITPRKTLTCHTCGNHFTDVLEFANHTISHKYEKINIQKK